MNSRRWWSVAILYSVLAGCAEQGAPVPSDRFHRLIVGAPTTVYDSPRLAGTMEVDRFRANSILQDRPIIFVERDNPNVMRQYDYQLWADPPTRMLQMVTVDYLRQTRLADRVVATGLRIVPTYTLIGDIKKLEQVLGNSSSILVELEFGLRRMPVGGGVRAGAGFQYLVCLSGEGLPVNRVQHFDDLCKTEQHDAAQKARKERSQREGPADFVLHVERAAEKENGQYHRGSAAAVEHCGKRDRVACRQVVHVLTGKLCHGSQRRARSADRLVRISSTASLIARVAPATVPSFTVRLAA